MTTESSEVNICYSCSTPFVGEGFLPRDLWRPSPHCRNCVEYCEDCDDWYRWLNDHLYRCDSCCDRFCPHTDYSMCDECEEYRCESCGPCSCSRYNIHEYSYAPSSYRPKGNYPQEVLMGVELEVGREVRDIAEVVNDFDPGETHLYLKKDGSIEGLEIVTHPMTLAWARDFGFDRLLDRLDTYGCEADYGYGLHVHVSRNAFRGNPQKRSTSHQMTWLMFMYRNTGPLIRLSRRDESDLDEWASFRQPERGELRRKALPMPASYDRYSAVNCQNHRTYELRFFRSTLDSEEFWAALEFADASVEYTRHLRASDVLKNNALSWRSFTKWVDSHDYPNLSAQIRKATRYITY